MKPHVMWFEPQLKPPAVLCTCGWHETSLNSGFLVEQAMKHKAEEGHNFERAMRE